MSPTATSNRSRARSRTAPSSRRSGGGIVAWSDHLPTDKVLLALVCALCALGLMMVGSASSVISLQIYGSAWAILMREALWMAVGFGALLFAIRFDYVRWRRWSTLILIITFLFLLAVLIPGLGVNVAGSSRWIGSGEIRIQPSELMKLALALFGADLLVRRIERGGSYRTMAGPLMLVAGAGGILILAQPDMGTALVVGCITIALLFASGVPMRPVLKVLVSLAVIAVFVGLLSPYRRARFLAFFDPGAHSSTSGYQVVQSLIGLGSGHLFGLGLGAGRQKWGYLPNAHTDFIFSVIGEELGLIGALAVLAMLGLFAWFGLRAAVRAPDRFGSLLAIAIVAWIVAETVINVGAVIGVLPVTGIPLPFISFGGSSLVITMLAAGILVNIARNEVPTELRPLASSRTPARSSSRTSSRARSRR
jgi:cell division protein FtsW